MGCPCGFPYKMVEGKLMCTNPDHPVLAPYQPEPTYADLIVQLSAHRKALEDICESYPHHKEQVDRGKELLNETH